MGTIAAVKKDNQFCIAADSCNLREQIVKPALASQHSCILKLGDSYLGLNSSVAYQQAFESVLASISGKEIPKFTSRRDVHEFFLYIHGIMRSQSFMVTNFQQDQDFEWSPMNAILINRSGIYKIDSGRAIYQFKHFWAIGSGELTALGAMHAAYQRFKKPEPIAKAALEAVAQFDAGAGNSFFSHVVNIPKLEVAACRKKKTSTKSKKETRAAKKAPKATALSSKTPRSHRR